MENTEEAHASCIPASSSPTETAGIEEEWRRVPGFDRYMVSNLGRIRSMNSGRILRPGRSRKGYRQVRLTGGKCHMVHRLVLAAFVGPPPDADDVVDHINRDPSDNRLVNLEWVSRYENLERSPLPGRWGTTRAFREAVSPETYRATRKALGKVPPSQAPTCPGAGSAS